MIAGRTSAVELSAASRSDPGRMRTNNEDLPLCDPDGGVYAVIDGVGGQAAGEVAAEIARTVILERLGRPLGTPAERVREAIALANNEIFKEADESLAHHGMTCVLTLALVTDHRLTIGHVGDSRLYKFSPDGIRKLTHDHSPVGEREDAHQISEVEAMRHPRRNEVFRDVGSECRDKDDEGFVEIVEDTLESDCALLLCTDGLSDMVPSSIIDHLVRRHAGNPQAVVDALVVAANDAGGKDNITAVYAEAPDFARAVRRAGASAPATLPEIPDTPAIQRNQSFAVQFRRWALTRGTTWFAAGAVVGVVAVLLLVWRLGAEQSRTLVVGSTGGQVFTRIADAMATARAGDVVQLESGTYKEQVVVPDGVDLVARSAGNVTLARAEDAPGAWTALTAIGGTGGRIYGIRIESTPKEPIDVGMRISGQGRRIEVVDISGPMHAGVELTGATGVSIRGSLIHTAHGPAITIDDTSEATIVTNAFVRAAGPFEPALSIADAARTVVSRNVFVGFGTEISRGLSPDERLQFLSGNFIVASEPTVAR
jgi:serine/threonine protein phosphatase PrpC